MSNRAADPDRSADNFRGHMTTITEQFESLAWIQGSHSEASSSGFERLLIALEIGSDSYL